MKHMADQDITNHYALCAYDENKIEDLNERLLQLLSAQKVSSQNIESTIPRPLGDINSNRDSFKIENKASASPLLTHYKYDCAFLHHDSPVNVPASPIYLPPIGVFWDIENCNVSIKLDLLIILILL